MEQKKQTVWTTKFILFLGVLFFGTWIVSITVSELTDRPISINDFPDKIDEYDSMFISIGSKHMIVAKQTDNGKYVENNEGYTVVTKDDYCYKELNVIENKTSQCQNDNTLLKPHWKLSTTNLSTLKGESIVIIENGNYVTYWWDSIVKTMEKATKPVKIYVPAN